MILLHKSLKRSEDIMRSLKRFFEVNCKTIDGVIECFNNDIGQGFILKTKFTYENNKDLCVWFYESLESKNIQVAYSTLSNVDENNNWIDQSDVNIKTYRIMADIKPKIIRDIFDNIKDYYGLNDEIVLPAEIKI